MIKGRITNIQSSTPMNRFLVMGGSDIVERGNPLTTITMMAETDPIPRSLLEDEVYVLTKKEYEELLVNKVIMTE